VLATAGGKRGYAGDSPAITRISLEADDWALVGAGSGPLHEPDRVSMLASRARDLVTGYPPTAGGDRERLTFVRVPGIDPVLGAAVLYYSPRTGTTAYCAASQITVRAAAALQALLPAVGPLHTGALRHMRARPAMPHVSIVPVQHDQLGLERHPAALAVEVWQVTALVCADMITARLADILAALCTAQASYLREATARAQAAEQSLAGRDRPQTTEPPTPVRGLRHEAFRAHMRVTVA
jgi:hypothetical protein